MNEPKKRGRPSKADIAARNAMSDGGELLVEVPAISEYFRKLDSEAFNADVDAAHKAQAYAIRVWEGQSESADRLWRIQRVKEALEGQGLSMEGVVLP